MAGKRTSGVARDQGPAIDLRRLRLERLQRVRDELRAHDCAACVLFDPVNIRFATDARNMQVFMLRNPARYLFIAAEGPAVLFEFTGCHHLAEGLETIDEIRPATTASFVAAGPRLPEIARRWADEIIDLALIHGGRGCRLAVERTHIQGTLALAAAGFDLIDAQAPLERARARKSAQEILCQRESLAATERAVTKLRDSIRPGISENELWSILHQGVIADNGDYVETRLLSSGSRTNPWYQEAGPRRLADGELVALDTDVVGVHGYYSDFSRTFFCGAGRPSSAQKMLYRLAFDQIQRNLTVLEPNMTFAELSRRAWRIPERYAANRYYLLAHGVGMTGEYPYICHSRDFGRDGYDGVIEPGMTLCLESYIGAAGGGEGVKLEEQVLIGEQGVEVLSCFPFEEALLDRED